MMGRKGKRKKVVKKVQKDLEKKMWSLTFATRSKLASSFRYWLVRLGSKNLQID
jgi:hypothetical protein